MSNPAIYDCEVFPNCFMLCATWRGTRNYFEISNRRNDLFLLRLFVREVSAVGDSMVGFNNLAFDYPLVHFILTGGIGDPDAIFRRAQAMIDAPDDRKWAFHVRPSDWLAPQIDLFKIHHFDNKARMTGLKALEFNMRMGNIADLPIKPGTFLTYDQMDEIAEYCWNDVEATRKFYTESREKIEFRQAMNGKYDYDFTNCSDVKIGKQVFQLELEKAGVQCYDYHPDTGRVPRQTPRPYIHLGDCIPDYVQFNCPEFEQIRRVLAVTVITETKGAFSDLVAKFRGLEFKYGTGGLHASVENSQYQQSDTWMIYDIDVTSLYPSIAIENGYYPEHLGPTFVGVYRQLRAERVKHKKGTPENAALKLALNGVYGDSNNPYSVFYDPLFTMKITVTGQMVMSMLVERLMDVEFVSVVQVNTDGVTLFMPRHQKVAVDAVCKAWEAKTGLQLEHNEFEKMFIADVNSYIALDTKGDVKRKGRYEWDVEWHQNASALVVPKVAEQVLLYGAPIRKTVEEWPDLFDFMLRAKVPRSSRLVWHTPIGEFPLQNTQRYFISKGGGSLVKIMPPLAKNPEVWRRIGVNSGWLTCPCNSIHEATAEINFDWYVEEVEKLCLEVI